MTLFASDQPVLASCYGASAADLQLLGTAAGGRPTSSCAHFDSILAGAQPFGGELGRYELASMPCFFNKR